MTCWYWLRLAFARVAIAITGFRDADEIAAHRVAKDVDLGEM
jgi:hypothetical protein